MIYLMTDVSPERCEHLDARLETADFTRYRCKTFELTELWHGSCIPSWKEQAVSFVGRGPTGNLLVDEEQPR